MDVLREVAGLISQLERSDAGEPDAASLAALERLLGLVRGLDAADVEALCTGAPRAAPFYGRYVQREESEQARALIDRGASIDSLERGEGGDFAGRSYARVRDMFERIDFTGCRELVMVGCGPLPVTLLHVAERTGIPRIFGLDVDEASVRSAQQICERWKPSRIEVLLRHGCDFDYGRADVVYLANLIRSKSSVLSRVAQTARPGTQVIVREPFAAGILFAESAVDPRDPRFKTLAEGPGDARFLSRHLFLERTHEGLPVSRST